MPVAQFAVFGHPIGHSLSPRIHQAFARQFGIELEYRAIDAAPADFAAAVQRFFVDGGRGANVTLPPRLRWRTSTALPPRAPAARTC
jgi:shikimate dehydrogenase